MWSEMFRGCFSTTASSKRHAVRKCRCWNECLSSEFTPTISTNFSASEWQIFLMVAEAAKADHIIVPTVGLADGIINEFIQMQRQTSVQMASDEKNK